MLLFRREPSALRGSVVRFVRAADPGLIASAALGAGPPRPAAVLDRAFADRRWSGGEARTVASDEPAPAGRAVSDVDAVAATAPYREVAERLRHRIGESQAARPRALNAELLMLFWSSGATGAMGGRNR